MIDTEQQCFQFPNITSIRKLKRELKSTYNLDVTSPGERTLTVLDDFDHAISKHGYVLINDEFEYSLYNRDENKQVFLDKKGNKFWWDFEDSALKSFLKEIIDLRALIPQKTLLVDSSDIAIRDEEGKIVARIKLIQNNSEAGSQFLCIVTSLRGYKKEFEKLKTIPAFEAATKVERFSLSDFYKQRGYGEPKQKSTPYTLEPTAQAEAAVRCMSLQMLELARLSEEGIVDDIDTEFLHQYRVHLRKVRSLLSLVKKAFSETSFLRYKTHLADIAGQTNELRDLDVLLLDKDSYTKLLPELHKKGIDALFVNIEKERSAAYKKVSRTLKTKAYHTKFEQLFNDFRQSPKFETKLSKQPILNVAKKLTLKRYRKIMILASQINETTPDEQVHDLRIECKKLRYMMEFFIDLFPFKRTKKLIKHVKSLQSILGDFNDFCVQKELLASYDTKYGGDKDISIATNGLIAILHQKQLESRAMVQGALSEFCQTEVEIEFDLIFGNSGE